MATAARKKSIANAPTIEIPLPTQTNTLLNKSASSSSSLYQQCSQLRSTLNRIEGFAIFLDRIADGQSPDPVNHLWDCFALGTPLCYLFNLLPPPATPIDIATDPNQVELDASNNKAIKIAIIKFIMAVQKMQQQGQWEQIELFQVTELTSRNMDGYVKVIATVSYLVTLLPKSVFTVEELQSPPSQATPYPSATGKTDATPESPTVTLASHSKESERRNIILELINTERKYVGDLEVMQKYATALLQRSVIDQDTILELFPGLNKLLDFQRRFLIKLEQVGELSWPEQRWGKCFTDCEAEFEVYAPYCANYDNAVDVLLREEQHLMELSTLIHPKSDLPAFLIKPVQRICKYPLLLDSLMKASSAADYPYYDELVEGAASAKRVTLRINEAQRRTENAQIVKNLETRIEDWKGHHITNFGELLLQDFFSVTKSDVDRDYHVFLFEKIILCCKEDPRALQNGDKRKVAKSNSILKKQSTSGVPANPFPSSSARKGTTPLLLKGRIFLNNVLDATPMGKGGTYDLRVSWRGDDDTEYFTLRCRNEEQLKLWESQINRLIASAKMRHRGQSSLTNSTNPAATLRMQSVSYDKSGPYGTQGYPGGHSAKSSRTSTPYSPDPSWRGEDGFDMEDEFDDVLPNSAYPVSGRGTPLGSRRIGSAQSMPPERDFPPGYDRPRARTEDHGGQVMQQWRMNMPPPPPPPLSGLPNLPNSRPLPPSRMASSASVASSESSFANRPILRSQFSSTKLRSNYEADEVYGETINRAASALSSQAHQVSAPPVPARSRSASIPSSYGAPKPAIRHNVPMPQPYSGHSTPSNERGPKRDSSSSHSTQESSDLSPGHSTSPTTPYGSTDSSMTSFSLRTARSQVGPNGSMKMSSPPIKVKVHYGDDLFVIIVNRNTDYTDLVEKVGKKIRLCGGRRDGGPLRVKYQDEDGDLVSLGSNEDVQMAFDTTRLGSGAQVTLFVM